MSDTFEAQYDEPDLDPLNAGRGQRLVIISIVLNFLSGALVKTDYFDLAIFLGLWAAVMAIMGVLQLGKALNFAVYKRVLFLVALFLPLINIVVLIYLSVRATTILRDAGYEVGLFGMRN